jgi:hypothetical protein
MLHSRPGAMITQFGGSTTTWAVLASYFFLGLGCCFGGLPTRTSRMFLWSCEGIYHLISILDFGSKDAACSI